MKRKSSLYNMVLTAMFIAMAILLPLLTANIQNYGRLLCPMHIPVLICGAVCGWQWGMAAGFISPLLRAMLFPTPIMYPSAVSMAFELAAYGLIIALMLRFLSGKFERLASIYVSMVVAMIVGRLVLALARFAMLGMFQTPYSWDVFMTEAVVTAVPAIVLQFAIIPPIVYALGGYGRRRR